MAKKKIDGVIEAVHYEGDGKIKWVRFYLRRGATYSDRMIIDRQALIDHLKAGLNFYIGRRVERMGGSFEIGEPLRLIQKNGADVISLGSTEPSKDSLPSVPRI
jgi:hypothetical protein